MIERDLYQSELEEQMSEYDPFIGTFGIGAICIAILAGVALAVMLWRME